MAHQFDPDYGNAPWRSLCADYPDSSIYPSSDFRVEWGPLFHRGRLDGSAKLLVLGQDPGAHEAIVRRILVGEAGQRVQGFLAKLGLTSSYAMVNTFLYSVYGQQGGEKNKDNHAIAAYRNQWLDALLLKSNVQAVVAFGSLADHAYTLWQQTQPARANQLAYEHVIHPTEPISSSGGDPTKLAAATKAMLASWNAALTRLHPRLKKPDVATPLVLYGDALKATDDVEIPETDLPAGLPAWMRSLQTWAVRTGSTATAKRATITITIPKADQNW